MIKDARFVLSIGVLSLGDRPGLNATSSRGDDEPKEAATSSSSAEKSGSAPHPVRAHVRRVILRALTLMRSKTGHRP
ncbi:hypothetical protein [Methylobacterium nodulans]|uniref:Uncharacterized protein n=1 Tax=Methylobacterium nodulans (strain LMG 21967 / CNCM I-2342 / ORS 2060) TaxID=460265 RepID=B8IFH2_METNO|nr:hypothetical protein [Methylobacterium nodulans]ACL57707.1 hypothetical protein Mnod_2755 [Methylobacterium nodulans ORS 2060]